MSLSFQSLQQRIVTCKACPRLVTWRETIAHTKVKRFADWTYWGKPVPGFGDINAKMLIVGLAPAAHGANRTGRMFTGDESGNWLYRALYKAGYANQKFSTSRSDGLILKKCYITAACRCAPPQNKPLPIELKNCREFIWEEIKLLKQLHVIIGLGKIGFDTAFDCIKGLKLTNVKHRPKFHHLAIVELNPQLVLIGSYHPSQQNTFTGKLTEDMLDDIFAASKKIINKK